MIATDSALWVISFIVGGVWCILATWLAVRLIDYADATYKPDSLRYKKAKGERYE